jgi:hypothetical protein
MFLMAVAIVLTPTDRSLTLMTTEAYDSTDPNQTICEGCQTKGPALNDGRWIGLVAYYAVDEYGIDVLQHETGFSVGNDGHFLGMCAECTPEDMILRSRTNAARYHEANADRLEFPFRPCAICRVPNHLHNAEQLAKCEAEYNDA